MSGLAVKWEDEQTVLIKEFIIMLLLTLTLKLTAYSASYSITTVKLFVSRDR